MFSLLLKDLISDFIFINFKTVSASRQRSRLYEAFMDHRERTLSEVFRSYDQDGLHTQIADTESSNVVSGT